MNEQDKDLLECIKQGTYYATMMAMFWHHKFCWIDTRKEQI